jgi:hypothetical protein
LKFIEEKTTGFVDAIAHTSLTGSTSEALAILVTRQGTSGDKIDTASSALVTIDDALEPIFKPLILRRLGAPQQVWSNSLTL